VLNPFCTERILPPTEPRIVADESAPRAPSLRGLERPWNPWPRDSARGLFSFEKPQSCGRCHTTARRRAVRGGARRRYISPRPVWPVTLEALETTLANAQPNWEQRLFNWAETRHR
jgi:hypothetical protein